MLGGPEGVKGRKGWLGFERKKDLGGEEEVGKLNDDG